MLLLGKIDLNAYGQDLFLRKIFLMATNKEKKLTSREKMLTRARERYPERHFADLEDTSTPQEGVDNLDDAIEEILEDYTSKQTAYDESNSKLVEILTTDPNAAEFIQSWIETGDPRTALVETFGDDLGMDEKSRENFKAQLTDWRKRKSENDALNAEAEANWQNSLQALDEWGSGNGLTMEQKRDVMLRLLAITFNGMVNKYEKDDFEMAWSAMNHDDDVKKAKIEGEVAGRNERIAAARRERTLADSMPPSVTGGQGGRTPEVKRKSSPWAGLK